MTMSEIPRHCLGHTWWPARGLRLSNTISVSELTPGDRWHCNEYRRLYGDSVVHCNWRGGECKRAIAIMAARPVTVAVKRHCKFLSCPPAVFSVSLQKGMNILVYCCENLGGRKQYSIFLLIKTTFMVVVILLTYDVISLEGGGSEDMKCGWEGVERGGRKKYYYNHQCMLH